MIILGIDPGINNVGYGVIRFNNYSNIDYIASGLIKTKPSEPLYMRLSHIISGVEGIINDFKPNLIGMEEVFINKNAASSIKLCHARGAIMSVIGKLGCNFSEISPNSVKKTVTGSGHADKNQVFYMIKIILKQSQLKISPDESDALAVAFAVGVLNHSLL
ncbi:hypothetical protein phytr_9850 [Candidatus Phycorickettsia trachydisci]|uniref:Crossover junction endodeoxyribonuclease RuvC n=1 Tax=Candidatus Phycorickettsia trachydisci TaxID=2115978 RepID=A0A2P1P9H7_9RICK|nr:crossover junction endodeoxyribonuclease RuvC [Candidatus Phycorickettsia trachydisci]AVP87913.1 hypothetical protein phytr_9850 [Candidatus Phycorickettsia trachydisci]